MQDVSLTEVSRALDALALPDVDLVVGIASGGVVPAAIVADRLRCPLAVISLNFRDDQNRPRYEAPRVLAPPSLPQSAARILLVDDVSVSGSTLEAARRLLAGRQVFTLVMKGRADFVALPDIRTCVRWPWKMYPAEGEMPSVSTNVNADQEA